MEHKIADEIDEVLGRANQKDPDADIILTEYNSDGEEDADTAGWVFLPWDKIPSDMNVTGIIDYGSAFVTYGNKIKSKGVKFPSWVRTANQQSPPIPREFVHLYHRNTKIRMHSDKRD